MFTEEWDSSSLFSFLFLPFLGKGCYSEKGSDSYCFLASIVKLWKLSYYLWLSLFTECSNLYLNRFPGLLYGFENCKSIHNIAFQKVFFYKAHEIDLHIQLLTYLLAHTKCVIFLHFCLLMYFECMKLPCTFAHWLRVNKIYLHLSLLACLLIKAYAIIIQLVDLRFFVWYLKNESGNSRHE